MSEQLTVWIKYGLLEGKNEELCGDLNVNFETRALRVVMQWAESWKSDSEACLKTELDINEIEKALAWREEIVREPEKLGELLGRAAGNLWLFYDLPDFTSVASAFSLAYKYYRRARRLDSYSDDLESLLDTRFKGLKIWIGTLKERFVVKNIGVAFAVLGQWTQAVECYLTWEAWQGKTASLSEWLGDAHYHKGDYTAAIASYEDALKQGPKDRLQQILIRLSDARKCLDELGVQEPEEEIDIHELALKQPPFPSSATDMHPNAEDFSPYRSSALRTPPPLPQGSSGQSSQPTPQRTGVPQKEIVIAVMGITGAGKSTFIRNVTQQDVKIGTGIESETQEVGIYRTKLHGKFVSFIDTPGFDDTFHTHAEVLEQIGSWLGKSHAKGIKISGLIYLHPIIDLRPVSISINLLRMFQKLVGNVSLQNVVLATTMWDLVTHEQGEGTETQLKARDWERLTKVGMQVRRLDSPDANMSIVEELIKNIDLSGRKFFFSSTFTGGRRNSQRNHIDNGRNGSQVE